MRTVKTTETVDQGRRRLLGTVAVGVAGPASVLGRPLAMAEAAGPMRTAL